MPDLSAIGYLRGLTRSVWWPHEVMNLNERPRGDVDYARAASHYTGSGWSAAPMAFARAMRDAFLHARARVEEWWEATANSHVLRVADSVTRCLPHTRCPRASESKLSSA